eukprot:TRINITY_DN452_c2_g1_i1.p1 TRINITY_DN452_c2_g1~~TRINITY_DN452_c2_g1_i1.p1  ORF type:complete len:246 (+),score=70.71 TRINITY_DN452_c2_g1_i1:275-1012(+)
MIKFQFPPKKRLSGYDLQQFEIITGQVPDESDVDEILYERSLMIEPRTKIDSKSSKKGNNKTIKEIIVHLENTGGVTTIKLKTITSESIIQALSYNFHDLPIESIEFKIDENRLNLNYSSLPDFLSTGIPLTNEKNQDIIHLELYLTFVDDIDFYICNQVMVNVYNEKKKVKYFIADPDRFSVKSVGKNVLELWPGSTCAYYKAGKKKHKLSKVTFLHFISTARILNRKAELNLYIVREKRHVKF